MVLGGRKIKLDLAEEREFAKSMDLSLGRVKVGAAKQFGKQHEVITLHQTLLTKVIVRRMIFSSNN